MRSRVLYEDREVIVIYKPAGIATQTARVGQQDVVSELKNYLSASPLVGKKITPYLGVVHRLDQPVEGLLVFAKTKLAAAHLQEQLKEHELSKDYYAAVCGQPSPEEGTLVDYLAKDSGSSQAVVVPATHPEGRRAMLEYQVAETRQVQIGAFTDAQMDEDMTEFPVSLVDIRLRTGRFHQIRAQMAHRDWPLLGDRKYGSATSEMLSRALQVPSVALCAYHLEFIHPVSGKRLEYTVSPENKVFTIFQYFFR